MPANTPGSQLKHMTSPIDKFPPFSDESFDTIKDSREHHSGSSVRYAPARWEPRKTGQFPYDEKAVFAGNTRQRSRKSISETISTIRTRNGSVSANAQELAEALKAPVSYRLIVMMHACLYVLAMLTCF